ncbi:MOSC domain-containing protein [soil metagenome]
MRVLEIWRFPVKSLQGERLDRADLGVDGVAGDRQWALFDTATGFGLTARRHPELLFASARTRADGTAEITLPSGEVASDDAALSSWLARPVRLRSAGEQVVRRYENPEDFEDEENAQWRAFDGGRAAFQDSDWARVSVVSTATLGGWDRRRFRANLVLDGAGEDGLVGRELAAGSARLRAVGPLGRCVLTTRPQPGGVERDLDVLRTVHRERGGYLGIGARVARAGVVSVGDPVQDLGDGKVT